jgi:hypothetical protein
MVVELHRLGIQPDAILFAQVGNENPATYIYLEQVFLPYLRSIGWDHLYHEVRYTVGHDGYRTLGEECVCKGMLCSLAYGGRKGCSQKWKAEPLDAWVREHFANHLAAGGRIQRAIGYDAGPADSKRGTIELTEDAQWAYVFPLRDWGWDRDACKAACERTLGSVPPKSACVFCPATSRAEVRELVLGEHGASIAQLIVDIEANAAPRLEAQHLLSEEGIYTNGKGQPCKAKTLGLWGEGRKGGLVSEDAKRSVPCPTCNAKAGKRCRNTRNRRKALAKSHGTRRNAAKAAGLAQESRPARMTTFIRELPVVQPLARIAEPTRDLAHYLAEYIGKEEQKSTKGIRFEPFNPDDVHPEDDVAA